MTEDELILALCEAIPRSTKVVRDHWDTIMEGLLFKRLKEVCEERGISRADLTPEEWRTLVIEAALDNHKG